jgi:molybdopterin-containing oxidoreductase family membrane subunit
MTRGDGQIGYTDVDNVVIRALARPGALFWLLLGFFATGVAAGAATWAYQIYTGLGVTGLRQPTMWAVYITNFVFWVGIGHAGTLISAILYLFRSRWRTPVYRAAETMTIFAIATAGLFPLVHLGRVWWFYWLLPYPNERWLQPNFRSPLVWDAFAVGTYFTVSCIFYFIGLMPDAAAARDGMVGWRRKFYAFLSLGWQGSEAQWRHFSTVYLLLAGFITPLVLSVHGVVSWDFAMAQVPGWHSTIFAPYFVAGAIFSGCAMVITLLVPVRRFLRLEETLTPWHFDNLAKLTLAMSLVVTYSYAAESFMNWYAADPYERVTFHMRYFGSTYGFLFWITIACNSVIPLVLFSRRVRRSVVALWIVALFINVGMWTERYMIIAGSLATAFEPSQWAYHRPTWVEVVITGASFCWLLMWFTLFTKLVPVVSMTEVKEGLPWLRQALRDQRREAA